VLINIQRQPGANVIEVVDRVKLLLPQLQATLPGSVDVVVLTDRTTTIRASVRDVKIELVIAVVLVVMVIFLFLRNVSATSSPASRCRCRWSALSASCTWRIFHQQPDLDGADHRHRLRRRRRHRHDRECRATSRRRAPLEAALKGSSKSASPSSR
jgi:hypothetical protein